MIGSRFFSGCIFDFFKSGHTYHFLRRGGGGTRKTFEKFPSIFNNLVNLEAVRDTDNYFFSHC